MPIDMSWLEEGVDNLTGRKTQPGTSSEPVINLNASDAAGRLADWFEGPGKFLNPNGSLDQYIQALRNESSSATELSRSLDNRDQILSYLEKLANNGDETALETLFSYYASRASDLEARDYNEKREDSVYQRLEADLRKAGISPYIISGANPVALGTSSKSYSTSSFTSRANNKNTQDSNNMRQTIQSIFSLLGIVIGAMIMAA